MALSGHARRVGRCPLIGVRQTYWPIDFVSDEVVNSIDQMELLTFLAMDSVEATILRFDV